MWSQLSEYLKEVCQNWFIGQSIASVNALKMTYVNRGIVHMRAAPVAIY